MSNKQRVSFIASVIIAAIIVISFIYVMNLNKDEDDAQPNHDSQHTDQHAQHHEDSVPDVQAEPEQQQEPIEPVLPPEPESYTTRATLTAVGDIMMHSPQITAAYDAQTDTYSFDSYFTEVQAHLQQGDWVTANLEAPLAGKDLIYAGYPQFNAPESLADAMKEAGFNVITNANNHSLDRREAGVLRTLEQLEQRGFVYMGTAASAEEAEQIAIVENEEIAMAFLAYTYGTNGIPIPEGKSYLVNLIEVDRIIADIHKAKEQADVVTIALHFGAEYQRQPSEEQKQLAHQLIEAGADIILGSHPHVVQPYEWVTVHEGEDRMRRAVVIYSLGNFISNQSPSAGTAKYTDVGVIFHVDLEKSHPDGTVQLKEVRTVPTWVNKYTDNGKRGYRIVPIEDILVDKNDPLITKAQFETLDLYAQEMSTHLHSLAEPVDILPNR